MDQEEILRAQSGYRKHYLEGEGFPQSVASGDPTCSGAVLWTRVDPTISEGIAGTILDQKQVWWTTTAYPQIPDKHAVSTVAEGRAVCLEVALDPSFQHVVLRGFTPIWADCDHVVQVDTDGLLQRQQHYWYHFITKDGHISQTGHFRTLPAPGEAVERLRIGQLTCQDYTLGYFSALRFLAAEELDFFIHLGDYIYETPGRANDPGYLRGISLPDSDQAAHTLEDYRALYRTYRSDPDLQQLHERHAMIAIWDDHEYANDCYGTVSPDDTPTPDPDRRSAANRAWHEYIPARVHYDPTAPRGMRLRLYRAWTIGDLATLAITDERLYRSPHPCGEGLMGERIFSKGCPRQFAPQQTMLGEQQRAWFLGLLTRASTSWKLWANEVQLVPLRLFRRFLHMDAWDGFANERRLLLEEFSQRDLSGLIVLSGDLHAFEVNRIDKTSDPKQLLGVELMVGSTTSRTFSESLNGWLSKKARPSQRLGIRALLPIVRMFFHQENPAITAIDAKHHGYAVLTLTHETAEWQAKIVSDLHDPDPRCLPLWKVRISKTGGRFDFQLLHDRQRFVM